MALQLNDITALVHRTTGFVPASSDYTCCVWFQPTVTTGAEYITIFAQINDPSVDYDQWAPWLGFDPGVLDADQYLLGVKGSSADISVSPVSIPPGTLTHLSYVREGTTHRLYANGSLIGSAVTDIAGFVYQDVLLGTDYGGMIPGPMRFSEWREWDAALTSSEITAERTSHTAVRTEDLFTDTPLVTDLLDDSGNGHHWFGAGNFEFVSPPVVGTAKLYNLTGPVRETGGAILCFVGPPWKTVEWRVVQGSATLTPFTTYTDELGRASCRLDVGHHTVKTMIVVGVAYVP